MDDLEINAAKPKDIIYMEADDAIDDILELIKKTAHENILLIPSKNAELLQSRVNMKFLVRTTQEAKKNLILVTGNVGLIRLANSVGLPTAKTQLIAERFLAGEEIAEDVEARDKNADVIDGEKLTNALAEAGVAVNGGELKKDIAGMKAKKASEDADASDEEEKEDLSKYGEEQKEGGKKKKIPNFAKLRTRIIIGVVVLILAIGAWVWMFKIAPAATVIVTARTTRNSYSQAVVLSTDEAKQDLAANQFYVLKKELVKTDEAKFEATGEKNAGERATGIMTLTRKYNNSQTLQQNGQPIAVSEGTIFTDPTSKLNYIAAESGTLEKCTSANTSNCGASLQIDVIAENAGTKYNDVAKAYTSEYASFTAQGSAMSGGTDNMVKIVTADDIKSATEKLAPPNDILAKNELANQIGAEYVAIEQSIDILKKEPESTIPIGDEAKGVVSLKQETVYTQIVVPKAEIERFLDEKLAATLKNQDDQRIYSNGINNVFFDSFTRGDGDGTMSVFIKTDYEVGPEIDEVLIMERSKGGTVGDVQKKLGSINGVRDIDVQFSYFWVNKVPTDESKITIVFEVEK